MITPVLSSEHIAANADPANYWEMAPGGPLHDAQVRFLEKVEHDPVALGFEGTPEEAARLRVAAAYLQDEERAAEFEAIAHAIHTGERLAPGSLAPSVRTPYEVALIGRATRTLENHRDTRAVVEALRDRYGETSRRLGTLANVEIELKITDSGAHRSMRRIFTEYENRLYQPVVARLRHRAAGIPADQVGWEMNHGTVDTPEIAGYGSDEPDTMFMLALLKAAQRSFRIANTMTMSVEELAQAMDLPPAYAGQAIRRLAEGGYIRRNTTGDNVAATELLYVAQGRLARAASILGYRMLHHSRLLRLPQLERA